MKIKELNITANVVWSPKHIQPMYLACGTPSQQIDTSCNSSSLLQLFKLDRDDTLEMKVAASATTPAKFNKLLWNKSPTQDIGNAYGIIAGGCENGSVYLYSPIKMIKKEESLMLALEGKHTGPVHSLDFNNHQPNLLASGSRDCEILIWDINDPTSPMTPGAKANISADVTGLQWNKQVEHIMASTYGGRCVVYDLRKSASIIQITESVSGIKGHSVQWHPDVATQLILGCEDDSTPVCQVWDLRFATAPLKHLQGHQRGIMATSWCPADSDLFITSSKDNKIYVWNPNAGGSGAAEIVGEFPSYNQWSFDISWNTRDPSLVAASSVDGTVSVYSLLGAGLPPAQSSKFSAIADSFPGMEMPTNVPLTAQPQSIYLKHPPKWLPKKAGVSFGFGGRLLSWNSSSTAVQISQVVTEPELVQRSTELEEALSRADFVSYCHEKAQTVAVEHEKVLWEFIGATFKPEARSEYMALFKFSPEQVASKVRPEDLVVTPQDLADKMADLGASDGSSLDPSEQFEMIASAQSIDKTPEAEVIDPDASSEYLSLATGDDPEGLIRHALLLGDFESAVKVCLKQKKNSLALILASYSSTDLYYTTRDKVLNRESPCGLAPLVGAIVRQDLHSLVVSCKLDEWKEALVAVLTYASDEEAAPLAECLAARLEQEGSPDCLRSAVLCYLCAGNLDKFVSCWVKTKPAPDSNPSELQNLVEIIVVMERALTSVGKSQKLCEGSTAGLYLCHYASLLASQGALSTAVSYLSSASQGETVELRDRLYRSLGYQTSKSLAASKNRTTSSSSQHSYRRASTPFSSHQPSAPPASQHFQPLPPPMAQQKAFVPPPAAPQMFSQPHNPQNLGYPNQMHPQPMASQPPPMQPFVPQPSAAQSFGPPPSGPPPAGPNRGMRRNDRYMADPVTNPAAMFNPSNDVSSLAAPPVGPMMTPGAPPSFAPTPHDPHQDLNRPTPAAFDPSVPRGWNDPPPLSATRKAKQQQKSQPASTFEPPMMQPMIPETQQQFQGFQTMNQAMSMQQQQRHEFAKEPSPAPAPKEPLPPEHQVIQSTFNTLREKGFETTTNQSAKQRFQDIAIKLENLYDKLRAGQVSEKTRTGLHQIVGSIQSGDYHSALQIHSSTISGGNFTEMSQFMPAIKILINTCMQCQVFL